MMTKDEFAKSVAADFANAVEATYQDLIKAAVAAERDAIAQMFEAAPELVPFAKNDRGGCITCGFTPGRAAKAIRARGNRT